MVQITVEDILAALDEAQVKLGRLQLQRDGLLREVEDLSRRIAALTEVKEKEENAEKN